MKKFLTLLLALTMVLSLAAAGATAYAADAAELVSDAFIDPLTEWAQYDELIAQIKAETDFAKRTELMHQAEHVAEHDAYYEGESNFFHLSSLF